MADENLPSLAAAVADGVNVDWRAAEGHAPSDADRIRIRQFEILASMSAAMPRVNPRLAESASGATAWAFLLILVLAGLKVVIGAVAAGFTMVAGGGLPVEHWPHAACLGTFAVASAVLLVAGARDERAKSLGGFFLVIASAYADLLVVIHAQVPVFAPVVSLMSRLAPDAFLAYALWRFVSSFPSTPIRPLDIRVARWFLATSFGAGWVLAFANLGLLMDGAQAIWPEPWPFLTLADRLAPHSSWYWPVLFACAAPALPYLLWRSRFESREDRRRIAFFTGALVIGVTPVLTAVIASPFLPLFQEAANRRRAGLIIYPFLLSLVPVTAYAVLVHRVMDLRLIIRRATRYAAVRQTAWALSVIPLAYLVLDGFLWRRQAVLELSEALLLSPLLPALAGGAIVFAARHRLLRAIDRRFLRESPDFPHIVRALDARLRDARGVRDVAEALAAEADRAVHPSSVAVLLLDEGANMLFAPGGEIAELPVRSTLGRLIVESRQVIQVDPGEDSPIRLLLPADERRWLSAARARLCVPLVAWGQQVVGLVVLGEKRNELPFTEEEQTVLSVMAGQAAAVVENWRLREHHRVPAAPSGTEATEWDDEPAALCERCLTVLPSLTRTCDCGGSTRSAALPRFLNGKFRVLRQVGAGGMGVVYEAIDILLDRRVALKALPRLGPERVLRLQREARAMAHVHHPNLALILATEQWRSMLVLVVEYLQGGTLAERLRQRQMSPEEAIELAVVLADVLDRAHQSGVLHRDIKPSNVGFTEEGIPKLLDFGLAYMLTEAEPGSAGSSEIAVETDSASLSAPLVGTAAYLSPEAVSGFDPAPGFDLWSLAVLLYEAITGVNPFAAPSPRDTFARIQLGAPFDAREYCPGCPPDLASFLGRALASDPAVRPSTAQEFREDCQRLRAGFRAREY